MALSFGNIAIAASSVTQVANATALPTPSINGISVANEPIWSSKTGRNASGKMIGDIIAWKKTISISWPPLTMTEAALIRDTIIACGPFMNLWYYDTSVSNGTPQRERITVYCGNIPRTLYSLATGKQLISGITIQFIEQ